MRRERYHRCLSRRTVLQSALVVVLAAVGPSFARLRPGAVQDHPAPTGRGQAAVRQRDRDRLLGAQARVVHAGEEPDQPTAAGPPVAAHVGDGVQQIPGLVRVGHHPRVHRDRRLGQPPANFIERVAAQLAPLEGVVERVHHHLALAAHGLHRRLTAVQLAARPWTAFVGTLVPRECETSVSRVPHRTIRRGYVPCAVGRARA